MTGSPDYGGRVRIVGDPGQGCSSDHVSQFKTAAFQGPRDNSVGLESGTELPAGCFPSVLDLAVARNIRFGGGGNFSARRHVQCAERGGNHRPQHVEGESQDSNDPVTIHQPAVRRGQRQSRARPRHPPNQAGPLRRGKCLSGAADGADAGAVFVLEKRRREAGREEETWRKAREHGEGTVSNRTPRAGLRPGPGARGWGPAPVNK